eukprot:TRINITY_DN4676_c0_g1_i5.p2 TRINITY_DN4676_c0_g1~~TRINITY_DN4676_c0_g1_i5.p2  ORF type:complete len:135 (-),score=19.39 TRINITY_DN4676_c0_g1_i5:133-537(-)
MVREGRLPKMGAVVLAQRLLQRLVELSPQVAKALGRRPAKFALNGAAGRERTLDHVVGVPVLLSVRLNAEEDLGQQSSFPSSLLPPARSARSRSPRQPAPARRSGVRNAILRLQLLLQPLLSRLQASDAILEAL